MRPYLMFTGPAQRQQKNTRRRQGEKSESYALLVGYVRAENLTMNVLRKTVTFVSPLRFLRLQTREAHRNSYEKAANQIFDRVSLIMHEKGPRPSVVQNF